MSFPFPTVELHSNRRLYTASELEQLLLADSDDDESQSVKRSRTENELTFELPHANCEDELQRIWKKLELTQAELNNKIDDERETLHRLKAKEAELHVKLMDFQKCKKYKAVAKNQQQLMRTQQEWIELAEKVNAVLKQLVLPNVLQSENAKRLLDAYEEKTKLLSSAVEQHNQSVDRLNAKFDMVSDDNGDKFSSPLKSTSPDSSHSQLGTSEVRFKGKSRFLTHANALSDARANELKKRANNRFFSST